MFDNRWVSNKWVNKLVKSTPQLLQNGGSHENLDEPTRRACQVAAAQSEVEVLLPSGVNMARSPNSIGVFKGSKSSKCCFLMDVPL